MLKPRRQKIICEPYSRFVTPRSERIRNRCEAAWILSVIAFLVWFVGVNLYGYLIGGAYHKALNSVVTQILEVDHANAR